MRSDAWRFTLAGGVIITVLLWAGLAWSVPTSLRHQGRLVEDNGDPMTGQVTLKFTIYDSKSGGSIVWESSDKQVDLGDSGFYSVTLGDSQNPINSTKLQHGPLWVGLTVDGGNELTPRLPIESVPYAIRSSTAESVADGAVGTDSLKDDAVSSQKIAGLDWTKVQNKPETLSNLSCRADEVAQYDGSQWSCGSQGTPLAGQSCGTGQVADGVDNSGNLQCTNDADTTYSAGSGLSKSGSTFSLADQSCSSGQYVDGIQNGNLRCRGTGAITSVNAGQGLSGGGSLGSVTVSLADQSCGSGKVASGISSGSLDCTSAGDITGVTTGDGLSGGGSNGNVSLSIDYTATNCSSKSFVELQTCPAGGDLTMPDCDEVPPGSICEYDNGCGLNATLDNCGGTADYYVRSE